MLIRLSVAVMPRDSVIGTRASIINRLRDMNEQIHAIDQMSENIEKGFHGTRMVSVHGLDVVSDFFKLKKNYPYKKGPGHKQIIKLFKTVPCLIFKLKFCVQF